MRRFVIIAAVSVGLVLADFSIKEIASGMFRPEAVSVIPGLFNLAYVENRGCAWGMFQGHVWPLAAFGIVALALLIWKRRDVFDIAAAEPLLYAGIVGNLIDRVWRGYVIDMFDFHWGCHHFPCFNLADSCICVAVGLLLLGSLCRNCRKPNQ